jgi:hypothetical protein
MCRYADVQISDVQGWQDKQFVVLSDSEGSIRHNACR